MQKVLTNHIIAQVSYYNCGAYGSGGFNDNDQCQTTMSDGSRQLSDTGMNVILSVTGGILLMVLAIVILATTRRKQAKQ